MPHPRSALMAMPPPPSPASQQLLKGTHFSQASSSTTTTTTTTENTKTEVSGIPNSELTVIGCVLLNIGKFLSQR
eukprot:11951283-Alexandrium_andersonii.AAC.1